jgi:hypothetical protein
MAVDPLRASEPDEAGGDLLDNDDAEPISAGAPSPDGESPPQTDATDPSQPSDQPPPRRALKLVITVSAGDADGQRAVLAVGSEGCDPLVRVIELGGMEAALAGVPALLAEAEARWQVQPKYPEANRVAPSANRSPRTAPPRAPMSTTSSPSSASAPDSTGPGQLTLFV